MKIKMLFAILTEDDPLDAINVAKSLNTFAVNPGYRNLTANNVHENSSRGIEIYSWTINEKEDIERIKSLGVDTIITDFPKQVFPNK